MAKPRRLHPNELACGSEKRTGYIPDRVLRIPVDRLARDSETYRTGSVDDVPGLVGSAATASGRLSTIGRSRRGRPVFGYRAGSGPLAVSLISGAHADEPVGSSTLVALCRWLESSDAAWLLEKASFSVCFHVNPDGAHDNRAWTSKDDYTLGDYLALVARELPGDDVEFGFPCGAETEVRPENAAVANFLKRGGPYDFHASLHGMGIAEGAWFLINRESIDRTAALRDDLVALTRRLGVPLNDWDRDGEKGFHRIDPGFCTTPTSVAMQEHFENLGQPGEAAKFRPSSMEFVAALGGSPLAMVSEMPIFLVTPSPPDAPRLGDNFLKAKDALLEAHDELAQGRPQVLDGLRDRFGLERFPHRLAVKLQLAMVFLGSGLATLEELEV